MSDQVEDIVEERLVEAIRICWRQPDREAGWQRVRAHWPDIQREAWEYDARGGDLASSDVKLRPASITRAEVAAMEEAFAWLDPVPADDRMLIGAVLRQKARDSGGVDWVALRRDRPRWRSADGLRMRYARALAKVVRRVGARALRG